MVCLAAARDAFLVASTTHLGMFVFMPTNLGPVLVLLVTTFNRSVFCVALEGGGEHLHLLACTDPLPCADALWGKGREEA